MGRDLCQSDVLNFQESYGSRAVRCVEKCNTDPDVRKINSEMEGPPVPRSVGFGQG